MFENGDKPIQIIPPEKVGFERTEVAKLLMSIARRIRTCVNIPTEVKPKEILKILVPSDKVDEVLAEIEQQGYSVV